ncbi:MAG: serine hydrolase domain-containing protein [Chlorobiaceae bacterium]
MQSGHFFLASFLILAGLSTVLPAKVPSYDFIPLERVVNNAVKEGVFPGASLAVIYKNKVVFHKAFGKLTYDQHSTPADTTTMYDLASLTKAVVTTCIAMQLVERDSLNLQAPVSSYLPAFTGKGKDKITIEHLLRHTSGLRAHTLFSKTCSTPRQLFSTIASDTLLSKPGTKTLYSDLGFMLLGRIIETITGSTLDANFHNRFAEPLGMKSTMFIPPQSVTMRIAPVEKDTLWPFTVPRPLVHDQNAALLGGVAGHAGLYSTTADLINLVTMLMNGGRVNNHTYIHPATLERFFAKNESERALGWDIRSSDGHSSAGEYYSNSSYGHLGYTGTSIWIDPENKLAVIFLSNRVYPSSANIKIRSFRPLLHNTVGSCLGLKKTAEKVH